MRKVRSIADTLRALGILNSIWFAGHRALVGISGGSAKVCRYHVVAQPVSTDVVVQRPARGAVVREVDKNDPIIAEFPRSAHVIAGRFDSGARCFVVEVKGRFAGYAWLAMDGYDEDEVRCRFEFADPASSAWDFDVYVVPEFRMGRTFARLWDAVNRELTAQGVQWTFSRISAFNPVSVTSHKKMGMQSLFTATFVCAGSLQVALLRVPPFCHIGWTPKSRPVLMLRAPDAAWTPDAL